MNVDLEIFRPMYEELVGEFTPDDVSIETLVYELCNNTVGRETVSYVVYDSMKPQEYLGFIKSIENKYKYKQIEEKIRVLDDSLMRTYVFEFNGKSYKAQEFGNDCKELVDSLREVKPLKKEV